MARMGGDGGKWGQGHVQFHITVYTEEGFTSTRLDGVSMRYMCSCVYNTTSGQQLGGHANNVVWHYNDR